MKITTFLPLLISGTFCLLGAVKVQAQENGEITAQPIEGNASTTGPQVILAEASTLTQNEDAPGVIMASPTDQVQFEVAAGPVTAKPTEPVRKELAPTEQTAQPSTPSGKVEKLIKQKRSLARQMSVKAEKRTGRSRPEKMEKYVESLAETLAHFSPEQLERVFAK